MKKRGILGLSTIRDLWGLNKNIKRLSLVIFVYMVGWGIVNPYFPIYIRSKLNNYTSVGIVYSVLYLFSIFFYIFLGGVIDKLSKKRIISSVLILYIPLGYMILALKSIFHFIIFRAYHAFTATSLWLSSEAYLRGHSDKGKTVEAIGFFDSSLGLAVVVGGIIGALLINRYGFKILYAVSIFSFLAMILSFHIPRDSKNYKTKVIKNIKISSFKKEFTDLWRNKELSAFTIYMFFFTFSVSFVAMILPLFLKYKGATLFEVGIISAIFYSPMIFEGYFSTFRNKGTLALISLSSLAVTFFMLFLIQDLYWVFFLSILLGLFLAMATPVFQGEMTRLMPRKKVGEMSAVTGAFKNIAAALGPLIAGILSDKLTINYVFLMGFIITIFLILFMDKFDLEE